MRKLLLALGLLVMSSFAYNQAEVCEAQCQGWKFVWQDDYHFDYVKTMCAKDPVSVGIDMVGFWADIATKSVGLQTYMEAYLCHDVVTTYLQPQITACKATCAADGLSYAPNLYLDDYSAYYSAERDEITVRVRNNGRAYIPGAYAVVYTGESDSASTPKNFRKIWNQSVPGLRPHDVRYLPEGFERDEYSFKVAYTPVAGKYNVVRVVLTPEDPRYLEMGMGDNTHEIVINDLPMPAYLQIESANFTRFEDSTNIFIVGANISNSGEVQADAEVRYYLGSPRADRLAATESIRVPAGGESRSEAVVTFLPGNLTSITVQVLMNGSVVAERTLYPHPAFYYIYGRVTDESGRPIAGAQVREGSFSSSDFPLQSNYQFQMADTDEGGDYMFPGVFTEEGLVTVSARKPGYFGNSTRVRVSFNGSSTMKTQRLRADIVLEQMPIEISTNYPSNGRYIVETDKGRYEGNYTFGVPIPVRGENGTIFISSPNCSFFAGSFNTEYYQGYLGGAPNATCLSPDANDDYSLLQEAALVWEKEYSGEEPRMAVFDKRGDHVYVQTSSTSTSYCNIYGYDLVSGNQLFRFNTSSICNKISMISPAYDGSQAYVGIGAQKTAKKGETHAKGYIIAENGAILQSWDFAEDSGSLQFTSAGAMAELVEGLLYFYAPGNLTLRDCNLVAGRECGAGGKSATIESMALTQNRVLGSCNSTACVFRPAYEGAVVLDRHYTNPISDGNYVNEDVFVADHKGGSYFRGGEALWSTERKTDWVSISPGGSYVVLAYDPYGIGIFSAEGRSLLNSSASATGMEATERGVFYATHQGAKLSVMRLSTMVEPQSTTTSGSGLYRTDFISTLFNALVAFYEWLVGSLSSMFG